MSKVFTTFIVMLFVSGIVLLSAKTASAGLIGLGPGCSAIEGLDEATLVDGDSFIGKISCNGVLGTNPNGRPVDTTDDGDQYTDSLEACINDALVGYCSTIGGDESDIYTVALVVQVGNQCVFTLTFDDTLGCATSECSDHVDNDLDGFVDFPADPECSDYDDPNESG